MKRIKEIIRLLGVVLLITMAPIGIGLAGGVPLQITHKRESEVHAVEWVMSDEESEPELDQIKIIQLYKEPCHRHRDV